ncbi:MAG: bifunctional folylpolyglutamate synthase/dihydrofolate synthase [Actinomycetota bacterium]
MHSGSATPDPDDVLSARVAEIERAVLSRAPEHRVEPSLDDIAALTDLMGQPQHTYPVVHLTGTNGKTSTARMTERLLRELGLSTGRFTSPHLSDIRERIALHGAPISQERFVSAWDDVAPFLSTIDNRSVRAGRAPINFFQVLTAMAFAAFADAPVDIAVLEVGMGGTWDSTNVANGRVAVVTPVALDHQRLLGSTIEQIATQKAGIIKPGATAVLADQHPDAIAPLLRRATEVGAEVVLSGERIGLVSREIAVGGQLVSVRGLGGIYPDLFLPLHGEHQAHNLVLAIAAVEACVGGGDDRLDGDVVGSAVADMSSPGRLEVVRSSPTVIVDAAHNPAGARVLAGALTEAFSFSKLVGVVGVLSDKEAEAILVELEPIMDEIVITQPLSSRALPPSELAVIAREVFDPDQVHVVEDLPEAVALAVDLAESPGDLRAGVLATGSVLVAAQVRTVLGVR